MTVEPSLTYKVKTDEFEGPLDLLLSLIEQRKLFVNEISLAEVTNDYIAYIKSMSSSNTEAHIANISYFILVASTLILIKSKSLLPTLDLTQEETDKITDLEERLALYKIIKNASIDVKKDFGLKIIFGPKDRIWEDQLFVPHPSINRSSIGEHISNVLENIPKDENPKPKVEVKKIINIDEVIESLTKRIQENINISFKEFSGSTGGGNKEEKKIHVIVSFLAMLELVREGIIDVIQNTSFGDIEMTKQNLPNN